MPYQQVQMTCSPPRLSFSLCCVTISAPVTKLSQVRIDTIESPFELVIQGLDLHCEVSLKLGCFHVDLLPSRRGELSGLPSPSQAQAHHGGRQSGRKFSLRSASGRLRAAILGAKSSAGDYVACCLGSASGAETLMSELGEVPDEKDHRIDGGEASSELFMYCLSHENVLKPTSRSRTE